MTGHDDLSKGFQDWSCFSGEIPALAADPDFIEWVQIYNEFPPNPHLLDEIWEELPESSSILYDITQHPATHKMGQLIKMIAFQGEGLLIGGNGGLVAATGKTTDFWQGDEAQFIRAIELSPGDVFVQSEKEDQSTHSLLIKISTPIYDPEEQEPIGVLVIGLDQFTINFYEPCKNALSNAFSTPDNTF